MLRRAEYLNEWMIKEQSGIWGTVHICGFWSVWALLILVKPRKMWPLFTSRCLLQIRPSPTSKFWTCTTNKDLQQAQSTLAAAIQRAVLSNVESSAYYSSEIGQKAWCIGNSKVKTIRQTRELNSQPSTDTPFQISPSPSPEATMRVSITQWKNIEW